LFEAKTTRFNIILQHNVHDWPFTIDREFNWSANSDYPSKIVQLVLSVHGGYTFMITISGNWRFPQTVMLIFICLTVTHVHLKKMH
jgi:hypothetical protein